MTSIAARFNGILMSSPKTAQVWVDMAFGLRTEAAVVTGAVEAITTAHEGGVGDRKDEYVLFRQVAARFGVTVDEADRLVGFLRPWTPDPDAMRNVAALLVGLDLSTQRAARRFIARVALVSSVNEALAWRQAPPSDEQLKLLFGFLGANPNTVTYLLR